jgi:uncharacterized SAM-binding protein YcdF (DUF218 family)
MPKTFMILVFIVITAGCAGLKSWDKSEADAPPQQMQPLNGEAKILQSWQGDYPTVQLNLLPENQREHAVGFIGSTETFKAVWNAFKPEEAVPSIDFNTNFVIFAKNTQFYNRIRIGKVNVTNGVAEVLAMETLSARPIENKVAMSLVVLNRQGITGIRSGDNVIQINK